MCTLSYLVQELRTGDVAVFGSESYANLQKQLMSWEECEPLVAEYCEQAGLPATAARSPQHGSRSSRRWRRRWTPGTRTTRT